LIDVSEAYGREYHSSWRWTGEICQHIPRRTIGIFRRCLAKDLCNKTFILCDANSPCRWRGGEFIILCASLKSSRLIKVNRFTVAMLFGNPFGLLSYRSYYGAVLQVSHNHAQLVMCSDITSKRLVSSQFTVSHKPVLVPGSSSQHLHNGSQHSLPRQLQLIWWAQVSNICISATLSTESMSRITGISHLDHPTWYLWGSHCIRGHCDADSARARGCCYFVLCDTIYCANVVRLWKQWTGCCRRHGKSTVLACYWNTLSTSN